MPSSKTFKAVPPSGTSNQPLPRLLKYPALLPYATTPSIHDIGCYVIEHYGTTGLTILVYRQPKLDQVTILCGDWAGNPLDLVANSTSELAQAALDFVQKDSEKLVRMMNYVAIPQAQYFFTLDAEGLMLVDVQISLNKLIGPGMLNDIFGKVFRTQVIKKTGVLLDSQTREVLEAGTGSYAGDIILKPNRFREYHDEKTNTYQPMYVELRR
jgi:hypothetical protein